MKYLLCFFIIAFTIQLNGQDEKIVKKEVKTKKVVKKKVKKEESVSLEVNVDMVDGKEVTSYVLKETIDGKTKVTKWNGEGEMPDNLKEHVENVEIQRMDGEGMESKEEKVIIVEMDDNGEKKIMKWNSDEEMSEEMKKVLDENEIEILEDGDVKVKKQKVYKLKGDSKYYDVKVRMAIGLDPSADGVKVSYVEPDGPAGKAGVKENDTLIKIGEQMIFTEESVYKALSNYNPGDEASVIVLRAGKEVNLNVKLEGK